MAEPEKPERDAIVRLRMEISRLLTLEAEVRAKGDAVRANQLVARVQRHVEEIGDLDLRNQRSAKGSDLKSM
jgi:hypothetical protein